MQEELTVRVEHPELPAIRWNEAEVQQNLTEMLAAYTGRVYTPETIKDAKADRAAVNKLDKQLSDAARSAKAFYMKPLEEFLQSAKQMQGQCKAVPAQSMLRSRLWRKRSGRTSKMRCRLFMPTASENCGSLSPLTACLCPSG